MQERARRIADNESRFREINERLREDLRALPEDEALVDFVCECGRIDCSDRVPLTIAEYEGVRAASTEFLIVPGHDAGDVEDVVDVQQRYARVRKHPESASRVRARDPRRD